MTDADMGRRRRGWWPARWMAVVVGAVLAVSGVQATVGAAVRRDEPPPRLAAEAFFPMGAGMRVYLTRSLAAAAAVERVTLDANVTMARAGVVLTSPRPFYEWELYAGAGAAYRLDGASTYFSRGPLVAYGLIGARFEVLFLEYQVLIQANLTGWPRYGIRVVF